MSPRPGRITDVIDVDLPQPRDDETRESDRYFELVTEVREACAAGERPRAGAEDARRPRRDRAAEGGIG